jgi:ATP synthase I chain
MTMNLEDRILRRLPLEILAFSLAIAAASLLFFSPLTALFILAGGLFSAASFIWLRQTVSRFLGPDSKAALRKGIVFYILRLFLIIAVFLIIILLVPRMILAFAAGFSSLVPAILAETAMALSQMKRWKA